MVSRSSALDALDVSASRLGDAGLRPLLEALPHNTCLQTLSIYRNNASAAFARDVLLPAVRANTSLRTFYATPWKERLYEQEDEDDDDDESAPFLREAVALVERRSATP